MTWLTYWRIKVLARCHRWLIPGAKVDPHFLDWNSQFQESCSIYKFVSNHINSLSTSNLSIFPLLVTGGMEEAGTRRGLQSELVVTSDGPSLQEYFSASRPTLGGPPCS